MAQRLKVNAQVFSAVPSACLKHLIVGVAIEGLPLHCEGILAVVATCVRK